MKSFSGLAFSQERFFFLSLSFRDLPDVRLTCFWRGALAYFTLHTEILMPLLLQLSLAHFFFFFFKDLAHLRLSLVWHPQSIQLGCNFHVYKFLSRNDLESTSPATSPFLAQSMGSVGIDKINESTNEETVS